MRKVRCVVVLVGLAACGSKRPPVAIGNGVVESNEPTPSAVVAEPAGCTVQATGTMILDGASAPIELRVCTSGHDYPYGEEKAEDGFVIYHRTAVLVARPGKGELTMQVGEFDDGWESGETWKLIGVVPGPGKTSGAVALQSDGTQPEPGLGGHHVGVHVLAVVHGAWQAVFEREANAVDAWPVDSTLHVESCTVGSGTGPGSGANAGACRDHGPDEAVEARSYVLRWDGAAITEGP
jgi:hypothetical protein